MSKKRGSIFILLLSFAIYDRFGAVEWNTNLVIMYYVVFYSFALFWIADTAKYSKNRFDNSLLVVLSVPFIFRIGLNLMAINKDRVEYNNIVSNQYTDRLTWAMLIVFLIIITWTSLRSLQK